MQQTKSGETDLDALEILLANKDLSVKNSSDLQNSESFCHSVFIQHRL